MNALIKKFRFFLRLFLAFFGKHQKIIILGFLIGIFSFLFFPKIKNFLFQENVQMIGMVGRFTPDELPLEIQELISKGLTGISSDGQIYPRLAESWEINKEGKEYIFTLKNEIFWQDGKPIRAGEVNYNFSDVATTVLDNQRVKFELKEPFAPFLTVVSRPIFKKGLLGTGEYKVSKITKNGEIVERLILAPHKNNSKPKLVFLFYPTEEALRIAFKLGEVDIVKEIVNRGELITWKKIKITPEIKLNRFVALFFNTQDSKLIEKSLRQALAYAINKRWQPRALGPVHPQSWAYNPTVKAYNLDLEKAKNLLEKGKDLEEIELATIPSLLGVAEEIKKDWQELGVSTKVKVISSLGESFQALLITQEIPSDPDQYIFWHSTQELNISRYKSPKIDKLLEEGRKTFDQEKRKQIYYDFQKFLVEETPAVFLFHPTLYTISRL